MKKIFKIISLFIASAIILSACDEKEVLFEQFDDVKGELKNSVLLSNVPASVNWFSQSYLGEELDATVNLKVKMIGQPLDKAITVTIAVAASSEAKLGTHVTLPTTSVTIPAGSFSAAVSVKVLNSGFVAEEKKKLVLEITSPDVALATASTTATIELYEKTFCALSDGVSELVGSWKGDDFGYNSQVSITADAGKAVVDGLSFGFMEDWWGETVVDGGSFKMDVDLTNNTVTIPSQYIYTTDYKGDLYDYEVAGTGTWNNCGANPTLILKYDIYYPGDAKGLAATYSSYFAGATVMTATLTLNPVANKSMGWTKNNNYVRIKR